MKRGLKLGDKKKAIEFSHLTATVSLGGERSHFVALNLQGENQTNKQTKLYTATTLKWPDWPYVFVYIHYIYIKLIQLFESWLLI